MKVYPAPIAVGDTEGFTRANDLFGRSSIAEGMTNIVTKVEDPLVIALDGPWGSGKSTFLKMWAGSLRNDGFPVIVFDAFENDYVDDAFAALAREIIAISEASKSTTARAAENIKDRAVDLGGMLLRSAGKIAINVGVRAATAGLASAKDFEGIGEQIGAEITGVADKYMEQLLSRPNEQKLTVEAFKEALSNLPASLTGTRTEETKPLIFIIDELDRCKPLFALSILERIKHFMSVPNVHFVLGVHLRQLEASVRAVYGADIDAGVYLQKFIHLTVVNTDTSDRPESRSLRKYADHLRRALQVREDADSPVPIASGAIVRVLESKGGSFRTLERAFTVLSFAVAFTPADQHRFGALIGGLICLKILYPELFGKAKTGRLTLEEVLHALYLLPVGENNERQAEREAEWWTYSLADPLPPSVERLGENIWGFSGDSRRDLITHTANNVVDRLK